MDSLIMIGSCVILILFAIIMGVVMVSFDRKTKHIANILSNHRNALRTLEKLIERIERGDVTPDILESINGLYKRLEELEDYMDKIAVYADVKRVENIGHSS